jgi:ESCRT-I complex subunit VPS28
MSDLVSYEDYYKHCASLLQKHRMWTNAHKSLIPNGIQGFAADFRLHCPSALARLAEGAPAELDTAAPDVRREQALLVTVTELFITAMDTLNLKLYSADALAPQLAQLTRALESLRKQVGSPASPPEQVERLDQWRVRLAAMGAAEELDETQARQLLFDMNSAYQWFKESMSKH